MKPFAQVFTDVGTDRRINATAFRIAFYLASKTEDWIPRQADVCRQLGIGRDAYFEGLRQLESAGYIRRGGACRRAGRFEAAPPKLNRDQVMPGRTECGKPAHGPTSTNTAAVEPESANGHSAGTFPQVAPSADFQELVSPTVTPQGVSNSEDPWKDLPMEGPGTRPDPHSVSESRPRPGSTSEDELRSSSGEQGFASLTADSSSADANSVADANFTADDEIGRYRAGREARRAERQESEKPEPEPKRSTWRDRHFAD